MQDLSGGRLEEGGVYCMQRGLGPGIGVGQGERHAQIYQLSLVGNHLSSEHTQPLTVNRPPLGQSPCGITSGTTPKMVYALNDR